MVFYIDKKNIIIIGLLAVGLVAGAMVLARQKGGIIGLGANLSQVFGDSGQWVEIKPRVADLNSATSAASKTPAAAKAVAVSSKAKAVAKEAEPAVEWCAVKSGQTAQRAAIINEVAWMGTVENYSNEWIEFKNNSGQSLDIGGWQMQNKTRKIKISFGAGETLPAGGLYLLERTDDESVAGVAADKIYSGGLGNSNEALYLFDDNCQLQDSVIATAKWPAGDNTTKQTMARMPDLSWRTSAAPGGTPKVENK